MPVRVKKDEDYPVIEVEVKSGPWSLQCDSAPWWFPETEITRWQKRLDLMFAESQYTPDAAELALQDYQYIFVYGTLKKGCSNHIHMKHYPYIARAWTRLSKFVMIKEGNVPAVFFDPSDDGKGIQGEVYRVPSSDVKYLDQFEQNTKLYKRRKVFVTTEDGEDLKGWMYFGMHGVFNPKTATRCPHFTRKKTGKPYYSFTAKA